MKIGVSSYSFWRYMETTGANYFDICKLASEMGFEGIEFLDLDLAGLPHKDVGALADALRAHCAQLGLEICAYTIKGEFLAGDPVAEVARLKGCVDIAARLGAPTMRHDIARGDGVITWREAVRKIAPYIREVAAYAESKGVRTCSENHGFFFQDSARVEELILTVDHKNYGWLVDIGNFACADENSIPAVTTAAPYAVHAHAKDFLVRTFGAEDPGQGWFRTRQGRYLRGTIVGHGEIPVRACVDILRAAGYDGWLSYEFEGLEEPLKALTYGLENLKRMV